MNDSVSELLAAVALSADQAAAAAPTFEDQDEFTEEEFVEEELNFVDDEYYIEEIEEIIEESINDNEEEFSEETYNSDEDPEYAIKQRRPVYQNASTKAAEQEARRKVEEETIAIQQKVELLQRQKELQEQQEEIMRLRQEQERQAAIILEEREQLRREQEECAFRMRAEEATRQIEQEREENRKRLLELEALRKQEEEEARRIAAESAAKLRIEEEKMRREEAEEFSRQVAEEKARMETELQRMEAALDEARKAKLEALQKAEEEKAKLKARIEAKRKATEMNLAKITQQKAREVAVRKLLNEEETREKDKADTDQLETIKAEQQRLRENLNNTRKEALESHLQVKEIASLALESKPTASSEERARELQQLREKEKMIREQLAVKRAAKNKTTTVAAASLARGSSVNTARTASPSESKSSDISTEIVEVIADGQVVEETGIRTDDDQPIPKADRQMEARETEDKIAKLREEEAKLRAALEEKRRKAEESKKMKKALTKSASVATSTSSEVSTPSVYYTVAELRKKNVPGLDYLNREQYLSPEDFQEVFKCTKAEFTAYPIWKKKKLKMAAKLF